MDYNGFKKEIDKLSGINLDLYKENQMKRRINSLIKKNKFGGYQSYFGALLTNNALYDEFKNYITINVSEFYRSPEQFKILENNILPLILKATRRPKIWSAACSTGNEPYTIAMILNKYMPLSNINIIATDIDDAVIQKAIIGSYNKKSVSLLPDEFIKKHFEINNVTYTVKDTMKKCVDFRHLDLLKDDYPKDCDLIVCRNVLIYFTEKAKKDIYMKFNEALNKDGILFVGGTEQIMRSSEYNFNQIETFFYRKMD